MLFRSNRGENAAGIAALASQPDDRISKATSDVAAASEKAKQEAELAKQKVSELDMDLKRSKANEADLRARAATADRTAKAANEAKNNAEKKANDALAEAKTANSKVNEAQIEAAKAARDEWANKVASAEMAVQKKAEEVAKANERMTAAESNAKTAKGTLASAAKELQTAGLIDSKLEGEAVLAAIPDAIKKVAAVASLPDGARLKELADKLVTAERESVAARKVAAEAKSGADAALAKAKTEQDAVVAKYESELKAAAAGSTGVSQTAVANAVKSYQLKLEAKDADLKRTQDELSKEVTRYESRLAAQADEFRQQIVAARTGIMVATTDAERTAAERAARLFGVGADAYFDGRYPDAVAALDDATKANPSDARAWYYLGLSRWASGDRNAAIEAFKAGGQWESRSATNSKQVGSALERVQGPARFALDAYRP